MLATAEKKENWKRIKTVNKSLWKHKKAFKIKRKCVAQKKMRDYYIMINS